MIIPNKSTIAEEDIEVPYGKAVRESGGTAIKDRKRERDRGVDADTEGAGRGGGGDSASEYQKSPVGGLSGLSGLSAWLRVVDGGEDRGACVCGSFGVGVGRGAGTIIMISSVLDGLASLVTAARCRIPILELDGEHTGYGYHRRRCRYHHDRQRCRRRSVSWARGRGRLRENEARL